MWKRVLKLKSLPNGSSSVLMMINILDLAGKEFAISKSKNLLYVLTGCELLEAAIESWLEWDL